MSVLKSWLWTCVVPTLSSGAIFITLYFISQYQQVDWIPFIVMIWAVISLSATFILNSLASFLLAKKGRILQLLAGGALALIVPVLFMLIDQIQ